MVSQNSRHRIAIARLLPLIVVTAGIIVSLMLADAILLIAFGPAPEVLRQHEVLDPSEFQRLGQLVGEAETSLGSNVSGDAHVAVVIGLSTAREDIDAAILGPALCPGTRVLNIASSGGSFRELAFYLQALQRTQIRSTLTILGVHPVWLAGRTLPAPSEFGSSELRGLVSSNFSHAGEKAFVQRWVWLVGNRRAMHAVLNDALWQIRERVADFAHLTTAEVFPDRDGSPWESHSQYEGRRAPQELRAAQLAAWTDYGWFDPARFSAVGSEATSLRAFLDEARVFGPHVVAVLLPEESEARRRIPPNARRAFLDVARDAFIPVIDMSQWLPDDAFYDYAHANAVGRQLVSNEIGRRLSSIACPR